MLGSGAADYEEAFKAAQAAFPANVRAHVGFSVPLSHKWVEGGREGEAGGRERLGGERGLGAGAGRGREGMLTQPAGGGLGWVCNVR